MVMGDAAALETAVLNLIDNAVKYSRERVKVEASLDSGDGLARLRVRDKGVGMTRAHLRLIFNRFYRIGSEVLRSRTGTGAHPEGVDARGDFAGKLWCLRVASSDAESLTPSHLPHIRHPLPIAPPMHGCAGRRHIVRGC